MRFHSTPAFHNIVSCDDDDGKSGYHKHRVLRNIFFVCGALLAEFQGEAADAASSVRNSLEGFASVAA